MDKLKPCQHCGSKAQINKAFGLYQVGCPNLFCPCMTRLYETETEAIEAWNRGELSHDHKEEKRHLWQISVLRYG